VFCEGILDNEYFYGLQKFINDQGVPLVVHEIVDNNKVSPVPPEDGKKVIYRPPTLEDYQRELGRCQDVLLWLNYRHTYPEYEDTDHVVTGVGFSYDNQWIIVSDPWTTGAPDHNNNFENKIYNDLQVLSAEPLLVLYAGTPVQVTKMVYISPTEEKYLDNLYDLEHPISSQLHELYPVYCRRYHLTSWIDTNRDHVLSSCDIIDITDENGVVTWWHVDNVTITMLVENVDNIKQVMYIELDPKLFPMWESIKRSPTCTMWHEIWPVFCKWYHLTSWVDDGDNILDYCDIIDITDEESGVVSWWHVLDVKYDIIVQPTPPVEYYEKENMPDLGQHCINWCWTAAAANSIKWWAEYRGYKELLDDPSDNVLDENYLQLLPGVCPWDPVLRLLVEIAKDCLFPGVPENEIPDNLTWCSPVFNAQYFYGLQEFIREQGAPLYVHEIVDNDHFAGHPEPIPPEDGENVIYDQPTFENYKREIERCQDVLLQLDFRNSGYESYPPGTEALDHIVTGVSFYDDGVTKWIEVADPWTPVPWPGPVGGPDHNNDENRYTYERLPVVSEDPLIVTYTGESYGVPVTLDVQVVKLIYISPMPWTGTATFKLETLYKLNLYKDDLLLNVGNKLVVKFYAYDNSLENENVIHVFTPPWQVVPENENVVHPGKAGVKTGVKKAKLWLVDNENNEISKIKGWHTIRDDLWTRLGQISARWPYAPPGERDNLWMEIGDLSSQWPYAPSTRDPIWVNP